MNVSKKRNVLPRLRGGLPDQCDNQLGFAIASFRGFDGFQKNVDALSITDYLVASACTSVPACTGSNKWMQ